MKTGPLGNDTPKVRRKKPGGVTAEPVYILSTEEKALLKSMETPQGRMEAVVLIQNLKLSVQTGEADANHKERRIERLREQRERVEDSLRRERSEYKHLRRNVEAALTQTRALHHGISSMENFLTLSFRRVDEDGEEMGTLETGKYVATEGGRDVE